MQISQVGEGAYLSARMTIDDDRQESVMLRSMAQEYAKANAKLEQEKKELGVEIKELLDNAAINTEADSVAEQ